MFTLDCNTYLPHAGWSLEYCATAILNRLRTLNTEHRFFTPFQQLWLYPWQIIQEGAQGGCTNDPGTPSLKCSQLSNNYDIHSIDWSAMTDMNMFPNWLAAYMYIKWCGWYWKTMIRFLMYCVDRVIKILKVWPL